MFSNNSFAKVWEVQTKQTSNGKTIKTIRISTSRKKEDGTYEQDFSGYVNLYGKAAEKTVNDNDRIQLLNVGVTSSYDKEKKTGFTNFICFDFKTAAELDNGGNSSNNNTTQSSSSASNAAPTSPAGDSDFMNIPDGIEDELPFN